jgi:hypothetical protein
MANWMGDRSVESVRIRSFGRERSQPSSNGPSWPTGCASTDSEGKEGDTWSRASDWRWATPGREPSLLKVVATLHLGEIWVRAGRENTVTRLVGTDAR